MHVCACVSLCMWAHRIAKAVFPRVSPVRERIESALACVCKCTHAYVCACARARVCVCVCVHVCIFELTVRACLCMREFVDW